VGDQALTRETPAKRGRVNRYDIILYEHLTCKLSMYMYSDLVKFKLNVHRVLYKLSMYMYSDLVKFRLNVHRVLYHTC
jgi:hypothetical protein